MSLEMTDKKTGVIETELEALDKKVSTMEEKLIVLEKAIESILTPTKSEIVSDDSIPSMVKDAPISPMASQISSTNSLLDSLLYKINAITDRIEV